MTKAANPHNESWAKFTLTLFAPIIKNILEKQSEKQEKTVVDADSMLDMGKEYAKTLQEKLIIRDFTIATFLVSLGKVNQEAKIQCETDILEALNTTIRRHISSKVAMTGKAFIVSLAGLVGTIGTIIGASCLYTSALASNPIALGCIAIFALAFALALTGIVKGGLVVRDSAKWTSKLSHGDHRQLTGMHSKIFNTSQPKLINAFAVTKTKIGTDKRINKQYNSALASLKNMGAPNP